MAKHIYIWTLFTILPALIQGAALHAMKLQKETNEIDASQATRKADNTHSQQKVWLALKNNLLYDLALAPNIEVEIPIQEKWSLNIESKFPWWRNSRHGFCYQMLSGGVELRYRPGRNGRNKHSHNPLSRHFFGVYAEGGKYDFQFRKEKGYRGTHYIATGISYGYTHPIARRLALEFSIGVGFLDTKYRKYTPYGNYLVWTSSSRYQAFLPTKAKVSLVWFLTKKR